MHDELYIEYIQKELLGTISAQEKSLLAAWKRGSVEHQELADKLHRAWNVSLSYGADIDIDMDADFRLLQKKIHSKVTQTKTINLRPWIAAAASILILLVAFFTLQSEQNNTFVALEDGHEIILPDGTSVEMAVGSKLEYGSDFTENRTIKLEGAALLKVSHDEMRPFSVLSPHLEIKVLGTIFFVRDKKEDTEASVQLLEGSVEVRGLKNSKTIRITPKQSVVLDNSGLAKVESLNVTENAWYYGSLNFVEVPLSQVKIQLEKRYNASIIISENIAHCYFTGNLKGMNLKAMLELISMSYGASVEYPQLNEYKILRGSCN
ncbi:MAG: ferric-dicitrate binding protein FerR (iron transport regulator) [Saprospiraceae bacterium]|jgi:ferric-dicitrate binding protein FerR (iron transport regulator)